ncbi:MAG: RsmD family RNA methyltransferase [Thermodesulfobacteriota bacterium]|nr:RsmD family RNA methyltransferase [Thermodesulfobacteriota bacterium]
MRVISGNLKGKKLYSVLGKTVRPTSDRLRETIFNILAFHVKQAIVLDMFSGTGALGIEALSRGAESAVFIDIHNKALSVIKRNIKACKLENKTKVIKWDIIKNLNCIKSDKLVKSQKKPFPSFRSRIKCGINCSRARSEALALSSKFNKFWMPDQVRHDVFGTFYDAIKSDRAAFNLIFIDPPYNKSFLQPTLHNLRKAGRIKKGACLIVEHSLLEPIPLDFPEYELQDQRKYGETLVSFLSYIV